MMQLSHTVRKEIVDFLVSLPRIHDAGATQALIQSAGLDGNLLAMIHFSGPPAQFFALLVPILLQFGKLEDGREALVAVLEAAKPYVGQEGQAECERLRHEVSPHYDTGTAKHVEQLAPPPQKR